MVAGSRPGIRRHLPRAVIDEVMQAAARLCGQEDVDIDAGQARAALAHGDGESLDCDLE